MSTTATPTKGLEGVVAANSSVCYIDGDAGVLAYRGIDIHELAEKSSFEETCYLLWFGKLPTRQELDDLKGKLAGERKVDPAIFAGITQIPKTATPMEMLRTAVSALSWFAIWRQMQPMAEMADIAPPAFAPWQARDFVLNATIWWAMMPGMMLPSATPMILTFATIARNKRSRGQPFVPTTVFTAGCLVVWGLFGVVAALADWLLERTALILPLTARLARISRAGSTS